MRLHDQTFRNINSMAFTSTFDALSHSKVNGTVCPDTKPVHGNETVIDNGPDLQQKQQKFFCISFLIGS